MLVLLINKEVLVKNIRNIMSNLKRHKVMKAINSLVKSKGKSIFLIVRREKVIIL
jgi:hypothetical protein